MKRWSLQICKRCLCLPLIAWLGWASAAQAVDNLDFRGGLVNAPCTLRAGDEDLTLEFGTVIDKYLYTYARTPSRPFALHLDDCDTTVLTGVTLTFSGSESLELPGLLALDPSSQARGIAVGIESGVGQPWPLNGTGATISLMPGNMVIPLQAYIRAEPTMMATRGITYGGFTATAAFTLSYQ
ncbi:fimbrial protein [Aeromonas hydrophila]|uniref:fimbrial protein n=1 Tax=Aeromonas hydrophila TaxID=644 RepID=UPI000953F1CA|nr:fimbrial protein [Aeromonas hydrophila]SIR20440.1 Pilin (type 1 fimbria component protein) [Aeromonas hydrophila]SIR36936.1 Pilin (type 1 fimbria component protein) [Aeromonas hydrophila]